MGWNDADEQSPRIDSPATPFQRLGLTRSNDSRAVRMQGYACSVATTPQTIASACTNNQCMHTRLKQVATSKPANGLRDSPSPGGVGERVRHARGRDPSEHRMQSF